MAAGIRNSVKAIIIENGSLLLAKFQFDPEKAEYCYLLPGGGQEKGETLAEALKRELREEAGCEVEPLDLAFVREYIDPASQWGDVHQVELCFFARRLTGLDAARATQPDANQIGLEWVPLGALKALTVYPARLKEYFTQQGEQNGPVYMGSC